MRMIGTALRQYAADHNGAYPRGPEWYMALDYDYLRRQGVLMCPARMAVGPSSANVTDYLFNPTRVSVNEPGDYPLMWDKRAAHDELGRNVLFADGRVAWVAEEEFEKILIKYKISETDIPWLAPSTDSRGR
jgi:prepilin-type processing-associated H-X9-DG protein